MLRVDSKNVNYSAASVINTQEDSSQIAYFNASKHNERCDISINIENITTYLNNLTIFENDLSDFLVEVTSTND